jgi:hypothetical protein
MIGKIERIPLRDVWKHEAYDFTQWLQDNIDVLSNVTNINLSNPEREQNAGNFNVDIVADDCRIGERLWQVWLSKNYGLVKGRRVED